MRLGEAKTPAGMRLYAIGLAAITGEPPARLVLFSLPDARAVDVPSTPTDTAALTRWAPLNYEPTTCYDPTQPICAEEA